MRIIDWELTALQHRSSPLRDDTDPVIFVGNQADIARRASFTVLGVYYPKRGLDTTPALF